MRNIAVFVLVILATLASHFYVYAYPSLVGLLVEEAERDAARTATLLGTIIGSDRATGAAAHAKAIEAACESLGVMKFKIFDANGRVLYSTAAEEIGTVNENDYFREIAATGKTRSHHLRRNERSLDGEFHVQDLVETYVPIIEGGRFAGAFEIYYDITALRETFDERLRGINLNLAAVLAVLLALFVVVVARSLTGALRNEREHTSRLNDEIEHRLRIEEDLRASHGHFRHLAHHDPLTGLPNRTLFLDRFEHALANARRYGTRLGLLFIDLDRFKSVNDTYGHKAGDGILKAAAKVLQQSIRESDTAARIAGDEFAVLVEHADRLIVETLVARLGPAFASGLELEGGEVSTSASIGVSFYPEDGDDLETLLHRADIAMYRAKAERRGSWQYFSESPAPQPSAG